MVVGTADADETLTAAESYLIACHTAGFKASKWNETRNLLSRWFSVSFPGMILSTISIKKMATELSRDRVAKWDACFHTGGVFSYCAQRVAPEVLRQLDHDSQVLAVRDALLFALSADLCARGDDLYGLWLREECIQLFDKKGKKLPFVDRSHLTQPERLEDDASRCYKSTNVDLNSLAVAETMTIRMLYTKDKSSDLSKPVTITRIRGKYVAGRHPLKDTFILMLRYLELTEEVRRQSNDQGLFIGMCARRAGAKKTTCGGLCGLYHNLVSNTLNALRTKILKGAKVDTVTDKYTSHAIRGNAECAIVYAALNGASFSETEGLTRSRHTLDTHMKSYSRPADPLFVAELKKLRSKGQLCLMTPEEVLRVGYGPHYFK